MRKIILISLMIAVMLSGCVDEQSVDTTVPENITPTNEIIPEEVEVQEVVDDTIVISNEPLSISVKTYEYTDWSQMITFKNDGIRSTQDLYCGGILLSISNSRAIEYYDETNHTEVIECARQAIVNGINNEYVFDTGYSYKDTPSLKITSRLHTQEYIGTLPGNSANIAILDGVSYYDMYAIAFWEQGKEDEAIVRFITR
jgi:hypothetical protein